ncbi:MAG: ribonuclease P protein component [Magnetococcales bacterium]|nr:ribonuclease P protein component [Magnetococcales bacterium]
MKVEKQQVSRVNSFPKSARILTSAGYRRVTGRPAKKSVSPHFLLFVLVENGSKEPRLGITVSKKVGNAVVRNRIKRGIREFFRQYRSRLAPSFECVVIARPRAGRVSPLELTKSLTKLFKSYEVPICTNI